MASIRNRSPAISKLLIQVVAFRGPCAWVLLLAGLLTRCGSGPASHLDVSFRDISDIHTSDGSLEEEETDSPRHLGDAVEAVEPNLDGAPEEDDVDQEECPVCGEGRYCDRGACVRTGMRHVPAGPFVVGCGQAFWNECNWGNTPLGLGNSNTGAYAIDETEVTVGAYRSCVVSGVCSAPFTEGRCDKLVSNNWLNDDREDHPINCVSRAQSDQFCSWKGKRLCTNLEWEKAARGTEGWHFPWGDSPLPNCDSATINGKGGAGCGTGHTSPVATKPMGKSPFGCYDMLGNVSELTSNQSYKGGYVTCAVRVSSFENSAGGSLLPVWGYLPCDDPDNWRPAFGFRCCADLE